MNDFTVMDMNVIKVYIILLRIFAADGSMKKSMAETEEDSFDEGFNNWSIPDKSWQRKLLGDVMRAHGDKIKLDKTDMVDPKNFVLIPYDVLGDVVMSTMTRDLAIVGGGDLEIMFSVLIAGWNTSLFDNKEENRLKNPRLQVFYDEDVVFDISTAVAQHREHYSFGRWNQFKMLSNYREKLNMTVRMVGSNGPDSNNAIILLDNIIITTGKDRYDTNRGDYWAQKNPRLEPEADLKENGTWEKVETEANDEAEDEAHDAQGGRPKFCDLLPEVGPCSFTRKRYFFNAETGACETFFFGGCLGNENNFSDREECEVLCADRDIVEPLDSQVREVDFTTFEAGFDGWSRRSWAKLQYSTMFAKKLGITEPPQEDAPVSNNEFGAMPEYHMFDFRQPELTQDFKVENNSTLIMEFQLMVKGATTSGFLSFFLHLDPGFMIYVANIKVFDYKIHGIKDQNWHRYRLTMNQSEVEEHRRETGDKFLIITIKGFLGSGRKGMVVLDNVNVTQIQNKTMDVTSSTTPVTTTSAEKAPPNECLLEREVGECKASFTRFYFDETSKKCVQFNWTGCGGNSNKFPSMKNCLDVCHPNGSSQGSSDHRALVPTDPQLVCSLPAQPGRCKAKFTRFFFSPQSGSCETFIYGGCDLNSNNFRSEAECRSFCSPVMSTTAKKDEHEIPAPAPDRRLNGRKFSSCLTPCMEPPACTNPTHMSIFLVRMFYFDPADNTCKTYQYRGCPGSGNCFSSMLECDMLCVGPDVTPPPQSLPPSPPPSVSLPAPAYNSSQCGLPPSRGPCSTTAPPPAYNSSQCGLPPSRGPCGANATRFFYSPVNEKCGTFQWGGCGGNANNFLTKVECESVCKPEEEDAGSGSVNSEEDENIIDSFDEPTSQETVCSLPYSVGVCLREESSAYKKRFFYKNETGTCSSFWYSGCGGNHNNFKTSKDCTNFCAATKPAAAINRKGVLLDEFNRSDCILKPKRGLCRAHFVRWYFDQQENICTKFTYSGCRGNNNNFLSKSTCLQFCPPVENATRCQKVRKIGDCTDPTKAIKFFFDGDTKSCKIFRGCPDVDPNSNSFPTYNSCVAACSQSKDLLNHLEDPSNQPEAQSSKPVATAIVETILALIIIGLACAAVVLGYKHYQVRQSAERYRLFPPTRSGSVVVVPQDGSAPVAEYENPAYNNDLYNPPVLHSNNEITLTLGDFGNKNSHLSSSDS